MTLPEQIQHKINNKTKPLGALGKLEEVALQIALIQETLTPDLVKPHIVVFAASHGIANEGVSAYPSEVTFQMVLNFLNGGAAINVFTKQNGIELALVDAGVDYDFEPNEKLIDAKINHSTKSFLSESAMTETECQRAIEKGKEIVKNITKTGCNVIGFGEMGIGNTSSAAVIVSKLLDIPIEDCVGKGTGVNPDQYQNKITILQKAISNHTEVLINPLQILQTFGGFEIAMMCGAFLAAAEKKMILMVDGFIASSAFLCALKLNPAIKDFAIFCHQSEEKGHQLLLESLNVKPLLNLDMRLGEGTGCAVAYPLLKSAVAFLNEMASFESAGVSDK
ncbi:nicotinate-nucleotide--dimethylbenzimidazole phosphoribosyltransferase [Dyadobacter subterraneus]|uniref:Nicotinate-nucleotide--dimethylbenzimidazole phosphoribosyltransferase n=1 Tax=Dyadobacter subterraneus TaxID=2773304 RepID=A0ABR9WNJ0_9BACT|nr:nicotinate-nucleotide--dimethylbenzimidazole phosphoribosyltransferase [Dyadobacter subterraneus]MBE9466411.1 nicotinate-nucleotide--dimethylbenzimidazole phosphoribosyltransferase [Dyadobacter subterraneus]